MDGPEEDRIAAVVMSGIALFFSAIALILSIVTILLPHLK